MASGATVVGHGRSGLTLLFMVISLVHAAYGIETWRNLPTLDTFANYEDMQRYFDQRNMRGLRHLDNPTGDTFLAAFNQHNEQVTDSAAHSIHHPHSRPKREERKLPSAPRMLRFELADAVEPSKEVQQLLRQHRDRSMTTQATPISTSTSSSPISTTTKSSRRTRKPRQRQRRSVSGHQQPANFKVHMIPFEASDAREPDAAIAKLIQRGRALDLEQTQSRNRKPKRSKRSAPLQVLKFELADARAPPEAIQSRPIPLPEPTLLTMETKTLTTNLTQTTVASTTPTPRVDDNLVLTGESTAESKRMYVYKEAPPLHTKTKKSLSALPHEVQKVITQLMKDGHGGKAYVKYMPAQKSDFEHYKAKSLSYAPKPSSYIKYVPVKSAEHVQVHIQPVPVVEQLRYVYKPTYGKVYAATPTIAQPIVVQEASPIPTEEVHHTYTADLEAPPAPQPHPPSPSPSHSEIVAPHFRPSKPDPLQATEEVLSTYGSAHIKPIEHYKYEIPSEASVSPLIKIEYHAPADSIKEHYKDQPEFQELSTLIGKSPDDQIHGLTYLLAKEMQSKLQRQGKKIVFTDSDRPQDSTSPILFHPTQSQLPTPNLKSLIDHGSLGVHPGQLVGMAKMKQYVPIIEPGNNDVKEPLPKIVKSTAKSPTPSSFINFTPGHGLSHGYEGVKDEQQPTTTVEHIIHHPTVSSHYHYPTELVAAEKEANGLHFSGIHHDKSLHEYASKYAFGYRIRDFHTGNDFGHKQNRDLHGVTRGQYHILLPDGRIQNVIYHADDTGFHADVSFETGTAH